MGIYVNENTEIDCQYGFDWDYEPINSNFCKKCNENYWCPLSKYEDSGEEEEEETEDSWT